MPGGWGRARIQAMHVRAVARRCAVIGRCLTRSKQRSTLTPWRLASPVLLCRAGSQERGLHHAAHAGQEGVPGGCKRGPHLRAVSRWHLGSVGWWGCRDRASCLLPSTTKCRAYIGEGCLAGQHSPWTGGRAANSCTRTANSCRGQGPSLCARPVTHVPALPLHRLGWIPLDADGSVEDLDDYAPEPEVHAYLRARWVGGWVVCG